MDIKVNTESYYHIQLKYTESQKSSIGTNIDFTKTEQEFDLSEEEAAILGKQYADGCFFFKGKWIETLSAKEIEIRETQAKSGTYWGSIFQSSTHPIVTRRFIKTQPKKQGTSPQDKITFHFGKIESTSKNMFIVHGKDNVSKLELARMLEKMGFIAIILSEQPDKGRTIIEKFEQETVNVGYAFVLLTPDDMAIDRELYEGYVYGESEKKSKFHYRARQNVILELGYFVGKIGRNKVCCLYKGELETPSDIHGVIYKRFEKSVEECYKGIIDDLRAAGYEIKF
jgi:predicted nucleotide-binding protein